MISESEFLKWFNRSFWKAFKRLAIPVKYPDSDADRLEIVKKVYRQISHGSYFPSLPLRTMYLNKGNGVCRIVPVFKIEDYIVYYFCIKQLERVLCKNRIENTFGGWKLGGRIRERENSEISEEAQEYGRYSFNPRAWTEAFGEFNSLLFSQIEGGGFTHVLQFDLSNFYDSVRLDVLERWIREESRNGDDGWVVALLFFFLNNWNRSNTGLHPQRVGIPQDALSDCSRVLANFYLQKYDSAAKAFCSKKRAVYFRYADDQMILMRSANHRDWLMMNLTRLLDRYGLRVNQKKVDLWTCEKLKRHRCRNIQKIIRDRNDKSDQVRIRKFVKKIFDMTPEERKESWNAGRPLFNRALFFDWSKLTKDQRVKLINHFSDREVIEKLESYHLIRVWELNKSFGALEDLESTIKSLLRKACHNYFPMQVLALAEKTENSSLKWSAFRKIARLEREYSTNVMV